MRATPEEERQLGEQLDALANRSSRKFFAFSPNDVLVQVALPLVLILAIAIRLMHVAQGMAEQDRGPVILDLWKQQLILRIDRTLDGWEKTSGLSALPDFERILWNGPWPDDSRFQHLCREAAGLADPDQLARALYRQSLAQQPAGDSNDFFIQLYDPELHPEAPAGIPSDFILTPERRAFALDYIAKRCRGWRDQVEHLQWSTVNRIARTLPLQEGLAEHTLREQMTHLSQALSERGYPLLSTVTHAY